MSNEQETSANSESLLDSKLTPDSKTSPEKRAYLEVNNAEKYKSFMLNQLETKRFKPSSALSKVRDFLPMMKQSTEKLLEDFKENPDQVNIENVNDDDEHIEMNLALVAQSDSDSDDDDDESEEEEGEDEEESEGDSSSNSLDDINLGIKVKNTTQLKKLKLDPKKSRKGLVQVLNDDSCEQKPNSEIN
ncbi:unnamed protein product [Brachionus calyciflorus]|uniref:Uncharacterized protein n=1 Tax=Brachionus calyciflorus TaxID=104777 RepID=A0A813PMN1_9BILA|nr:unnamed protein product [Brachionus calyciflorus]